MKSIVYIAVGALIISCAQLGSTTSDLISVGNSEEIYSNQYSLNFDGASQYLESTTAIVPSYPFTISAWVRTSSATNQGVMGIYRSPSANVWYHLMVRSNGQVRLQCRNTTNRTITGGAAGDGNWHHLVGVFLSNTSRTLYVDGAVIASNTQSCTLNGTINRVSVGRYGDSSPSSYFNGNIDDVAIWNVDLSANAIADLYNSGTPIDLSVDSGNYTNSSDLAVWWRNGDLAGDDPAGGVIEDALGANNTTASGMSAGNLDTEAP